MKRGTDHEWLVVKYKNDGAVYAKCKCGFEYDCGKSRRMEDGMWSIKTVSNSYVSVLPVVWSKEETIQRG